MHSEQDCAAEATGVRRCLLALVSAVCRRPRTILALSLLLCGLSIYGACTRLQYHTQRNDLISPKKDYQQRWRAYLEEFGDDDDIVVVVKGHERQAMQELLEAVAARLRAAPELFDRLFYKVDLRPLHNRALLFLPLPEIRAIQRNLDDMKLLLEFGPLSWHGLNLQSLLREGQSRIEKLQPGQALSDSDRQFFTQLAAVSRSAAAMVGDPAQYHNPWSSLMSRQPDQRDMLAQPQYFFSGDGTLAFLLVRPIKEKGSFTAALKSVAAARAIVAEVKRSFPRLEVGLTGLPVLETDEMAAAQRDTQIASWLAIAGVTVLFFLVYRSIYYPLLTVATLLVGTAWAMGWVTLTVGHLNILSATFAIMLIGMGDYGVLWVMRYEQARRQGMDVRQALLHTTSHVAIGNLTAASTLALAFFAAILADFQAVAELGWIAGCGVLLCAFACFTVLPALLMLFDRRPANDPPIFSLADARPDTWLPNLSQRPGWVLAAGAGLVLTMGTCAGRIWYDHNLLHLQAQNLDAVKWEMTLIEHTAGASWHALSFRDSPQEALALKERYEKLPGVSRVVEVATLVPAQQEHKMPLLADIGKRLRSLPKRGTLLPHLRPSGQETARAAWGLRLRLAAATSCPNDTRLLTDLQDHLKALEEHIGQIAEPQTVDFRLQDFDQRLAGDLAEDLHCLRAVSTPAPIRLADLPVGLRERYVGKSGKWLLRVFAKDCLWDFEPLEAFTREVRAVDAAATGKPFGTVEGLRAMKNGLIRAGVYAFLVIALVLYVDFRSVGRMLVALLPLVLGVLLSVGLLGLLGLPLNPANMIAFPLILGVGVDNGVHILHDWLIRRREGRPSISYAIGRGVMVKALTTMIGFGTLMISTERGLAGLGLILTLGVGCSMVTALVLLPALLQLVAAPRPEPAGATLGEIRQAA
jgi:hopanoid biosynthesis associated RND transporter like protein HpnN